MMKDLLSELADYVNEKLPEDYRSFIMIFPEGNGRVETVSNVDNLEELIDRLQIMINKVKTNNANIEFSE